MNNILRIILIGSGLIIGITLFVFWLFLSSHISALAIGLTTLYATYLYAFDIDEDMNGYKPTNGVKNDEKNSSL